MVAAPPGRRPRLHHGLLRHARDLVVLAAPVVVARSGIMVMGLVDTVMVGRFSAEELAYLGIGLAPITVLLLILTGLLMGTLVVTAAAFGSVDERGCGAVWRRSLPYALVLGTAGAGICAFGEPMLRLLGQNPELAREGGAVVRVIGLGLPGAALFLTSTFFLEGLSPAAARRWVGGSPDGAICRGLCRRPRGFGRRLHDRRGARAAAVPLIAISTWILIAGGGQGVMTNALRRRGETWVPTLLHTTSYFLVMIPLGWLLAFPLGRGAPGLTRRS